MDSAGTFDFWYAVNNTDVKLLPRQHLETFGSTALNYHLISELMDTTGQVRIREGRLQAHRPQIITPQAYSHTALDGFGDEARKYIDWLKEHEQDIRILQYGYTLKQEAFSEYVLSDSVESVVERIVHDVREGDDSRAAVVVGVDEPWDVCIVRLFWEIIQASAPSNVRDMQQKQLFESEAGVPRGVRQEIDAAFKAASQNSDLIQALGAKLQLYGLFPQYEDRFFALVKAARGR